MLCRTAEKGGFARLVRSQSERNGEIAASKAQLLFFARELKDARVLITGASGFLGSRMLDVVKDYAAEVVCLSRQRGPLESSTWLTCDYFDRANLSRVLARAQPDVVVHLAGFASSQPGISGLQRAVDANAIVLYNLLLGVADICPSARVVTAGSLESSDPLRGTTTFSTPYGGSKVLAEVIVHMMKMFAGLSVTTARIGMTYGPGDPNAGRLVPYVISSLLVGKMPTVSIGNRVEDWVYVDDVLSALLACAVTQPVVPPAIDVGTGDLLPVSQVVQMLARLVGLGTPVPLGPRPDRPGTQQQADVERTRAAVGWSPLVGIEAGLRETVKSARHE